MALADIHFYEQLVNYTSDDTTILNNAILALNSLVAQTDDKQLIMFLPKLEDANSQFKGKNVLGLARPDGWQPLTKLLAGMAQHANQAQLEREFAALVELLAFAKVDGLQQSAGNLAQLTVPIIGKQRECCCSSTEVREAALHALKALLDKFQTDLPPSLQQIFAELQFTLLAILPDKSSEPIRELAHQCLGQLIKFHTDPNSLFLVISDMSDDCELMLKDDPLLDNLLDQTLGRMNELDEQQQQHNGKVDDGTETQQASAESI